MYSPPVSPILFVGSSSIRMWPDLENTFADYVVLNRGVGGAIINDVIFYADDIIFPYNPRQIIIYVGENDLPDENNTADSVFHRFKNLYKIIRNRLPNVPIAYIAIKPSPSREKYVGKAKEVNGLISRFLKDEPNAEFIDIFTPMITKGGNNRPELFVEDMLHMNKEGYKIWRKAVEPYLLKKQ